MRGGEVGLSHWAHNSEIGGSNPPLATKLNMNMVMNKDMVNKIERENKNNIGATYGGCDVYAYEFDYIYARRKKQNWDGL